MGTYIFRYSKREYGRVHADNAFKELIFAILTLLTSTFDFGSFLIFALSPTEVEHRCIFVP